MLALGVALAASAVASAKLTDLNGRYRTVIKNDPALQGALDGTWVIKFTTGHYKVSQNGKLVVRGTDKISGNKISLTDTAGPGKCRGTGTYKAKLAHDKLKFTKISDPSPSCVGRVGVLAHRFTKIS